MFFSRKKYIKKIYSFGTFDWGECKYDTAKNETMSFF